MNLEDNKHLKEVEKILDNWDINKGYLVTNDNHGVDLIAEINIKELGFEVEDEDDLHDALELHYDGANYYYQRNKDDYYSFALIASSCEEIFITYEGDLCFPDENTKAVTLSSENREIEIIAYSLEWMHETGCFPSIFSLDYFSNSPTPYNFYETNEYKALGLSDDDKVQAKEVEMLVSIIEFTKTLDVRTQTLGDLPFAFYEALPEELQKNDGYTEVISVEHFDQHTMEIEFELEEEEDEENCLEVLCNKGILTKGTSDKGGDCEYAYIIKISLLPNSVRFMKGLDDVLGLTTREVA